MPAGRPRKKFRQRIADQICQRIATSALSLEKIVAEIKVERVDGPSLWIVYCWLRDNLEFAKQYKEAKDLQSDYLADMMMEESLNPRIGETVKVSSKHGKEVKRGDNVARSRLIVDTIKTRAAQLSPKKYNDKFVQAPGAEANQLDELEAAMKASAEMIVDPDKRKAFEEERDRKAEVEELEHVVATEQSDGE
jgi:hypothetical protein